MNDRGLLKTIGVVSVMFFAFSHLVMAAEVRYIAEFSEEDLSFSELGGYDLVYMRDAGVLSELGKPVLPAVNLRIAIPAGNEVIAVEAQSLNSLELEAEFYMMPGQPPLETSKSGSYLSVEPDDAVYSSSFLYPGELAEFSYQTDLAGQEIAEVTVYPLQYAPEDKRLILHKSIELIVRCTPGKPPENEFAERYYKFTERQRSLYMDMLKKMIVNPDDVFFQPPPGEISLTLPPGDFCHVIITSTALSSYFQPLVDWHMKRGLRDTVVSTSFIYAYYTGADEAEKIRNFVIDVHSNWGTMYFLMGGEHNIVPFVYRRYYGPAPEQNTPSDQYYSDYDDDWTHEVIVGRASVDNPAQITRFVNKVLKYEKDPPLTDYPLDILLIGMDADVQTHFEILKEKIADSIPAGFNINKVYDIHDGNHRDSVLYYLNAGQNLVNHADHSNETTMGTGHIYHNWSIYNSDVDNLTNTNEMSISVSLGCETTAMDYEDCIAEHFVIYNDSQAGVAFTGNTRHGYTYIGVPASLSGQLDLHWWYGVFTQNQTNLGKAIIWSKHQLGWPPEDPVGPHCEWAFNFLGEPAMPIWTNTPANFNVTHDLILPLNATSFSVHVEEVGGSPVDSAYVCIWKGDEIYEREYTDGSGDITFTIAPYTNGTMYVTVTKHNYLPYEGGVIVGGHVLDLIDFPMYEAESNPGYNEMCGPAVAQMTLNYMFWNSITHPDSAPLTFDNQAALYDTGIVHNSNPSLTYFDLQGMWYTVQYLKPEPYTQYGYNFAKHYDTDQNEMLKQTCQWIDYTIGTYGGHEPGHPYHVPAIVPAYGDYTNWMAVRGIHTDTAAYPLPPSLTIYGFWVNDPVPGGIGENTFKTAQEFATTYYLPLATGDEWDGKYVAVFEPPESGVGCELTIAQPSSRFSDLQATQLSQIEDLNEISVKIKEWIIQAAINGVNEELIPYDENFKAVFETTVPGEPFFVTSINNSDYFAVPFVFGRYFGEVSPKKEVNNELPVLDNKAMVVILIDASDGSFKEASWTDAPARYLPLSREEAREIAFEVAQTIGLGVDINSLQPELIHRKSTPYYPEWRVIIRQYAIYISQDGTVSIEEFVEGGTGSGGVMSEEGSFVYSLNTAAPTPFVNSTMISYSIAQSGHVSLDIYDVTGRLVKTLVHANKDAGVYSLRWNGCDNNNRKLATGVYFTKLTSRDFISVKKIILAR